MGHGRNGPPYRMDFVQKAIAIEKEGRRIAEQQARVAGAGVVYLQSMLAAVVQQAGGSVVITPQELELFAHPEPIATVTMEGNSIRLIAAPVAVKAEEPQENAPEKLRGKLRDGDVGQVSHPRPTPPTAVGLCHGCGNEAALFAKVHKRSGQVSQICTECLLLA